MAINYMSQILDRLARISEYEKINDHEYAIFTNLSPNEFMSKLLKGASNTYILLPAEYGSYYSLSEAEIDMGMGSQNVITLRIEDDYSRDSDYILSIF